MNNDYSQTQPGLTSPSWSKVAFETDRAQADELNNGAASHSLTGNQPTSEDLDPSLWSHTCISERHKSKLKADGAAGSRHLQRVTPDDRAPVGAY